MAKRRGNGEFTGIRVLLLCMCSFVLGVILFNRLKPAPEFIGQLITLHQHTQKFKIVSVDCSSDEKLGAETDVTEEVHRANQIIGSLDESIEKLQDALAAGRNSYTSSDSQSTTQNKNSTETSRQKVFAVVGINTAFSSRQKRDSLRKTWMPQGEQLAALEKEKGIVVRFMIGHSAAKNSILDQAIDAEQRQYQDIYRLDHVEGFQNLSAKTKTFFSTALAKWDAEFYVKVDDDVHVNLGELATKLEQYRTKPRVYIGCMKTGPVVSQEEEKHHEPEFLKFGDQGNRYFRHAKGQIYAISKDLATFISYNRPILHKYANEDVSVGSWLVGLDVEYIDDRALCCGTPPDCEKKTKTGNVCVASFDWYCNGICGSIWKMKYVHERCSEGVLAVDF